MDCDINKNKQYYTNISPNSNKIRLTKTVTFIFSDTQSILLIQKDPNKTPYFNDLILSICNKHEYV